MWSASRGRTGRQRLRGHQWKDLLQSHLVRARGLKRCNHWKKVVLVLLLLYTLPSIAVIAAEPIKITNLDLINEIVTIHNAGDAAVDLSGWRLVSETGKQQFVFPANTLLSPGKTVDVISGPKAAPAPGKIVWTKQYVWNNKGDCGALYNAKGTLVSRLCKPK